MDRDGAIDPDAIVFKIKCGDVWRRFTVSRAFYDCGPYITFRKLEETIRRAFNIPEISKLAIVYTDKENDEVSMVNDDDIEDACVLQSLNPVRMTVVAHDSDRLPAHGDRPRESLATSEPPPWAADILLKLDQLLVAVNNSCKAQLVEPVITKCTMTQHHVLEGVDASPSDGSTIEPAKDVLPAEEWPGIGQPGYDSEFLRRAMILRQRVTDE